MIKPHDRVRLAWEKLALGTVESVDRSKGTAIVVLDAPLPSSKTGRSERKLSDLEVLASATRHRDGSERADLVSLVGHELASGQDSDPAAWAEALVNSYLYPERTTQVGRLARQKPRRA